MRQHYGYEKRQKEVAKQKKREEKRQRKLNRNAAPPDDAENQLPDAENPSEPPNPELIPDRPTPADR